MNTATPHPDLPRLLELLAAESIGDLSNEESAELNGLRRSVPPITDQHGRPVTQADAAYVLGAVLAASVDDSAAKPLKPEFRARLIAQGQAMVAPVPAVAVPASSPRQRTWIGPVGWAGWAAAAVAAGFFVWQVATNQPSPSAARLAEVLEDRAGTVHIALVPQGNAAEQGFGGEVIWSTQGQDGFLHVRGLPANDPAKEQYQLWLVDADRPAAAQAVDCGVFNAGSGFVRNGETYIPIRAKLPVTKPTTFAITLERPGGAVISTQQHVIATADMPPPGGPTGLPPGHWPPR